MLKRLILGALALVLFLAPPAPPEIRAPVVSGISEIVGVRYADAAGQWPQARVQVIGTDGRPVVGARAYFYESGTTTPLQTYADYSLGTENPAFVETDGFGRFPAVYFDETDEFYRVRVTTSAGVELYDDDAVPIIGPSGGGSGSETPIDVTALLDTGDFKAAYGTGTISGFVRCNARTIGSATSGATERANADTEELFLHFWTVDSNLTVSGGRGASAAADWAANKTIALPDCRGTALVGLDDMGNSAAGNVTDLTTLGETTGSEDYTLVEGDIPEMTTSEQAATTVTIPNPSTKTQDADGGSNVDNVWVGTGTDTVTTVPAHTHTVGTESNDAISLMQPSMGVTIYIKL